MDFLRQKKEWLCFIGLAVMLYIGGIVIRTANISKLKDITTGGLTLAPDLDPYLFMRWAKYIVAHGSLMAVDMMRYVPVGYVTKGEMPFPSYAIAYLYKFLHMFSPNVTVEYAAIISPVIFFMLAMIAFFFFVRQAFIKSKNASLIALISTALLSIIPGFLHRTMAGVPEKEAHAFVFMFLAYFFILKAWQDKDWKKSAIYGLLAGISTAIMGLAWGGVTFLFVTIGLTAFVAFFVSDFKRKEILAYGCWIFGFTSILVGFERFGISLFTSTTSAIAYGTLLIFLFHYFIFGTSIAEKLKLDRIKLPKKAITLIMIILLGIIVLLIIDPSLLFHIATDLKNQLFTPNISERISRTVAENAPPFFDSWSSSFGMLFWVFFLGSILLFYEGVKGWDIREKVILASSYAILICGVVFTRLSAGSILNGSSPISMALFLISVLLFAAYLIYAYMKKSELDSDVGVILILVSLFFGFVTARGSIRMLYFLYPIAPIVAAYAVVRLSELTFENKEDVMRISFGILAIAAIVMTGFAGYNYFNESYNEARYAEVPSSYNIQWQMAMNWTRQNTPTDAVFSHWWDYGYWVQSLGERATFLDGGNAIGYWDHLMGRTLTANNETEMLGVLYAHNVTYLLIDSSDIGKYPAFSSIGSDENYDRYSWISTFQIDQNNVVEKRNETIYLLRGGSPLDEDLKYKNDIFAQESSGIGAVVLSITPLNDSRMQFNQPSVLMVNQGKQSQVPVNCIYFNKQRISFDEGIDGCIYLLPAVTSTGLQPIGGALWLSPRLMRSEFSKMYLFDDITNFELSHNEPNTIVSELNSRYNFNLPEFILYNGGVLGPIKIWKINYPSGMDVNPDYLKTDYIDMSVTRVRGV